MSQTPSWTSRLKADPTDWLLETRDPAVRAFALTELLDRPDSDAEVKKERREAMLKGPIANILAKQNPAGHWDEPDRFYRAKYKGTVWSLIILAELGADGGDPRIRKACDFILENSQEAADGGFSYERSVTKGGGRPSGVIPCLTGNMVWALVRLGRIADRRVQRAIDWIVRFQRFDDGAIRAPRGVPYDRYPMCYGKHTCHMGVVKALKALAAIPVEKRSPEIEKTIRSGAEYLLKHRIYKKSHDLNAVSKPSWLKLGFPWMYQSDILEILRILTGLGVRDARMDDAVEILISKQLDSGAWKLENTFNGRFQTSIERKGAPSKWVTANAMAALKRFDFT